MDGFFCVLWPSSKRPLPEFLGDSEETHHRPPLLPPGQQVRSTGYAGVLETRAAVVSLLPRRSRTPRDPPAGAGLL